MLTGHHTEREALDLDAHFGRSQAFFCGDLRQIGRGNSNPVGKALGCAARAGLDECFKFHARSLVTDKRICQAFDCYESTKQTTGMEIAQIRRARLKAWFKDRTLPPSEKSYLSQLITGASSSFGEKAARRLEKTYEMPPGYLDTPLDAEPAREAPAAYHEILEALEYLLPGERAELEADIKRRAAHNKAVGEMLSAKPSTEARPPAKRPATAVSAGPPSAPAKKTVRGAGS